MSARNQKELYRRVDEVMHYVWDPISVSDMPMARDEYESYVPQVVRLLNENANEEQIASYLNEIVTERMGLQSNLDATSDVVSVLLDWNEILMSP
jgi:hypothetical protein